jgi:uncharacterized protein DUF1706
MDQPGVAANWSMKDMVAHLTGWNRRLINQVRAAGRGEPEPPPPWPTDLQTEDEVNAWIYESNRGRSVQEVLDDSRQMFRELFAVIESLPNDVQIEIVRNSAGREFYPIWLGGPRFPVGEFFDHFRDDHEPDVRAWLAREEK